MKEKKFKNLSFLKENILSREQMKNLIGGYGGQFGCPESQLPYLCINADGSSDCFCADAVIHPPSSTCDQISISCESAGY